MTDDDRLEAYRKKRDPDRSGEPAGDAGGGGGGGGGPRFVIQEHDASTLHYDLRLEVDGVLKSWAVPKGPSTDPRDRRLALPTEDHPLDYAGFEGVIPAGEYGGGTVLVWDAGPYANLRAAKEDDGADMARSVAEGKIEVRLEGHKLRGGYALIRTGGQNADWLLVKMDDDGADARRNPVSTEPRSVVSGRTLEEIAAGAGDGAS